MGNQVQLFVKEFERREVEILNLNDEILFNARNVGEILEIVNVNSTIENFKETHKKLVTNDIISSYIAIENIYSRKFNGMGENFLTEAGLYKLIFISRKPNAETFQDWVFEEVLPDIRKHGIYATPVTVDAMIADPEMGIKLLQALKVERAKRLQAEKTKAEIGSRREATAMNKASQAMKKLNKAKEELGASKKHASTLRVAKALKVDPKKYSWKPLKDASKELGLPIPKVPDAHYGEVNSYPAEAWKQAYGISLPDIMDN